MNFNRKNTLQRVAILVYTSELVTIMRVLKQGTKVKT
jgi:hypothetical protein